MKSVKEKEKKTYVKRGRLRHENYMCPFKRSRNGTFSTGDAATLVVAVDERRAVAKRDFPVEVLQGLPSE